MKAAGRRPSGRLELHGSKRPSRPLCISGLAHGHAHTAAPALWGGTSETASMYALTNTAATCGTIALPAPRRRATRPGSPSTRGSRPGLMRRVFPSAQGTQTESLHGSWQGELDPEV